MKTLADQLRGFTPEPEESPTPDVTRPIRAHREPSKRPPASVRPPTAEVAYPSLQAPTRVHLVGFPLRLSTDVVDQLKEWEHTKGIKPSVLVREMVEKAVAVLAEKFESEARS